MQLFYATIAIARFLLKKMRSFNFRFLILEDANIAATTYDDLENSIANVYSTIRNTNTVSSSGKKSILN